MDRRQFIQSVSATALGGVFPAVAASSIAIAPPHLSNVSDSSLLNRVEITAEDSVPSVGVVAIGGAASTLLNSIQTHLPHLKRSVAIDVNPFALHRSGADEKILVGDRLNGIRDFRETQDAFSEVIPKILSTVDDLDFVLIIAGFGGLTGTDLAPSVSAVLNQQNIFNIGFGITPFRFEGRRRQQIGIAGLHALEKRAGATFHFSNDAWENKLGNQANLDEVLGKAPGHFLDIYHGFIKPCADISFVGVDFEDIKSVMSYTGPAGCGVGYSNDRGAQSAVLGAIRQINLDRMQLQSAQGVVVVIESTPSLLKLREINAVMNLVKANAHPDASIIFSAHPIKDLAADYKITLMASGSFV